MNLQNVTLFLIGIILGIAGTLIAFSVQERSGLPKNDHLIFADGFRNITFNNDRFRIELVKRIDESTMEVDRTLEVPTQGFFRGFGAMEQLVERLENDGVIKRNPPETSGNSEIVEPPDN